EFQSSAARLESEERDLVETARRVVHQETRPLHTFDEPEPEPLADEAPLPFEPEEEGQVGWRFV
ncbi:MAG: hypothetical protein KDE50_35355, partial [Caldilineaceae bacterium]|nr:hypothetical protein [Caldilineaceae bacterium]